TDDAPFLSANYSGGGFDLDASVRFDRVRGEGTAQAGVVGPDYIVSDEVGSATIPSMVPGGAIERINYRRSYTSWSFGALYAFDTSTSIFARV
ncbi:TonB-dependent receptor, partial [Xylella fastidiosa subsp. multiplex]|nr:TonB-dependent receptor [Xylella fastidiosa subsp. multiplex]